MPKIPEFVMKQFSGYSDEEMAEAMKSVKNEIAKQMRDRWEEIKFNQKYN